MPNAAERAARARKAHSQSSSRRRTAFIVAAACLVLGIAGAAVVIFSGGDSSKPTDSTLLRTDATPRPTVDLARRPGGLVEGAVNLPDVDPQPPPAELRANGGRRFAVPVKSYAGIEDYFGTPRLYGQRHGGIDFSFAGLSDISVTASCRGTVTEAGESDQLGLYAVVDCGEGWSTVYGFLQSRAAVKGDAVSPGFEVGRGADGEHLHFEIRYNGVPLDPVPYIDVPPRFLPTATPTATSTPLPATSTSRAVNGTSPTATATSTPTLAPGQPTPTPTDTPTITPTATITPTPTWTPTATRTPARQATPTPTLPVLR